MEDSSFNHYSDSFDMYNNEPKNTNVSNVNNTHFNGGTLQKDDTSSSYISRILFISNLPMNYTESQLAEVLLGYGAIKKIVFNQLQQNAMVEFWDIRDAKKTKNSLTGLTVLDSQIDVQYLESKHEKFKDKNTGTLYVRPMTIERNFHDSNTLQQYKELFSQYGEVKKVHINRKREAEKFIEYYDLRDASFALEALNGSDFNGVTLEVQFANKSSKNTAKHSFNELNSNYNNRRQFTHPYLTNNNGMKLDETRVQPVVDNKTSLSNTNDKYLSFKAIPIKMQWNGSAGPSVVLSELKNNFFLNLKNISQQ